MKQLWSTRLRRHFQAQAKYLKLVFNDHFVLVLVILLGALLYGYSQLVRQLTASWWLPLVLAAMFAVLLRIGSLASLVVEADATLLLPQTSGFVRYLFKARRYSLGLPLVTLSFATVAILPLLKVMGFDLLAAALPFGAGLWLLKDADLWLQLLASYDSKRPSWAGRTALSAVALVALIAGFYMHPALVLLVGLVLDLGLRLQLAAWLQPATLNWARLVKQESRRMMRIYRFYNLFTDVPGLSGSVRRRKYLDPIARLVPKGHSRTWGWLLLRSFLRRTEFLGLVVRLAVIGAVLQAFVSQVWLGALFSALFIYLIGFQLLPLYQVHAEIVFTYLYPLPQAQKAATFKRLVLIVLVLATGVQAIGALVVGHWLAAGVVAGVGVVAAMVIAGWYLPLRLAKLA